MSVDAQNVSNIFLFTDHDLDGAGCYFLLRTLLGKKFEYKQTSEKNFINDFDNLKNKENYKKIYIFDLAIFKDYHKDFDLENVVYAHHRNLDEQKNIVTSNLKNESQEYSSCTKLLYTKLKDKLKTPLTEEQKKLILLIDDYDSYALKSPNSLKLNYLYWTLKYNKAEEFYNQFSEGFKGFTAYQQKIISDCEAKFNEIYKNLKIFKGILKVKGRDISVCSTFNSFAPSEICNRIVNDFNCDIVINVNLNNNYLNIRKSPSCDVHLGKFAEKLFDGGGDNKIAGGHLNQNFLNISKLLYPINHE